MYILVDPSGYHCLNMGDLAMLQSAVSRLRHLWPSAHIQVVTDAPDVVAGLGTGIEPLPAVGRRTWFHDRYLFGPLQRLVPHKASLGLLEFQRQLRRRIPPLVAASIRSRMWLRRASRAELNTYLHALLHADLVLATGGGFLTDAFKGHAVATLEMLQMASRRGTPTAMLGQGLGPMRDPQLLALSKAVLPKVGFIALREGRVGPSFLSGLGVDPNRVLVTGDDAIELAYKMRSKQPPNGLGVNLRVAAYSGVDETSIEKIRLAIQTTARRLDASLVPVPISRSPQTADARSIRSIVDGFDNVANEEEDLNTPEKVIAQVGRCRLVVTGSYHAAVFALSQGIPAIGLVKSDYYADKFLGLSHQFGSGCEILNLDDECVTERLSSLMEHLWYSAGSLRPHLLAAAERQIMLSREGYRAVRDLVSSKRSSA